jgi:tripartite-type tricarboxylate transporter receptor subunit TctC
MRRRRFAALAGASVLAASALAKGQAGWKPEKPITIYNPFAAGGGTDIHIRLIGETAGPKLGQPILVDSRPGAAGTQAPALLLNARPDEHHRACMNINSPVLSALPSDQLESNTGFHLRSASCFAPT